MLSNPFERDFLKIAKTISHQKNHAILIKQLVTAKHMTKGKNKSHGSRKNFLRSACGMFQNLSRNRPFGSLQSAVISY